MTSQAAGGAADRGAAYFDGWYTDLATSSARDELFSSALGLPAELQLTSLLTWPGIAEVTAELRLPPGGQLLDLACGRGGYGLEIARRTGARLLGVDFSAVALEQARASSALLRPAVVSCFRLGTLVDTGLPSGSVQGVVCVDAVQFAEPPLAALREVRRVLAAGGRLVLTCWEPVDPTDKLVPARLRAVDLQRDLVAAGCVDDLAAGGGPAGACHLGADTARPGHRDRPLTVTASRRETCPRRRSPAAA